MKRVLAIDTADSVTCVAVQDQQGKIFATNSHLTHEASHNEELTTLMNQTLVAANCKLSDLDLIIVGAGPGSFTGLRIAYGFLKGLSIGLEVPLVQQCSFAAAFHELDSQQLLKSGVKNVLVLADARRAEFFVRSFILENDKFKPLELELKTLELTAQDVTRKLICFRNTVDLVSGAQVVNNLAVGHIKHFNQSLHVDIAYNLNEISQLSPNYVRAVNAKTITERRQSQ